MVIAVDFDGTCTTHDYPKVGQDIGAVAVLQELVGAGHQLILYTMRSKCELQHAIDWFGDNKIPLYGVQLNPDQAQWTNSNKCYAQLYIDDAALGCPLTNEYGDVKHSRPFVDWEEVYDLLRRKGLV